MSESLPEDQRLFEVPHIKSVQESAEEHADAAHARLQTENLSMLNDLARQGYETDPPLLILQMKLRLDMLHSLVIGNNEKLSLVFEHSYESRLNELLNEVTKDAARQQLLKGVR